jgi:hypothetical protein
MNNFLHRNLFSFGMDFKRKFREAYRFGIR